MLSEAFQVATLGFSVVFITLLILAISVKMMSFLCRGLGKKEVRKGGKDYGF